jgi:hypothetical protein
MTSPDLGIELCARCGLCCDGTLFGHGKLTPEEASSKEADGLTLFEEEGSAAFRQPCPHFRCSRCAIYETRFQTCRKFECALLKRVKLGQCTIADAQGKIALAKRLRAKVAAEDPAAITGVGRGKARARLAGELENGDVARAQHLLDMIALDTFLERWFRGEKKKSKDAG